jgi:hypothetical protein
MLRPASQGPAKRPLRRPGTAAPRMDTKARTMHLDLPAESSAPELGYASGASSPAVISPSASLMLTTVTDSPKQVRQALVGPSSLHG